MIQKAKEKGWRGMYGWAMKMWGCGYGILVGKIYGILNLILLVSTYMIVKGLPLGFTESIILGIAAVSFIFVCGIIFVKLDLLKAESASNFVENPQQVEILNTIRQIKKDVEEIKNDRKLQV